MFSVQLGLGRLGLLWEHCGGTAVLLCFNWTLRQHCNSRIASLSLLFFRGLVHDVTISQTLAENGSLRIALATICTLLVGCR